MIHIVAYAHHTSESIQRHEGSELAERRSHDQPGYSQTRAEVANTPACIRTSEWGSSTLNSTSSIRSELKACSLNQSHGRKRRRIIVGPLAGDHTQSRAKACGRRLLLDLRKSFSCRPAAEQLPSESHNHLRPRAEYAHRQAARRRSRPCGLTRLGSQQPAPPGAPSIAFASQSAVLNISIQARPLRPRTILRGIYHTETRAPCQPCSDPCRLPFERSRPPPRHLQFSQTAAGRCPPPSPSPPRLTTSF